MKRLFTLSQSIFSNSECLCTSQPATRLTATDLPQCAPIPITHCNSPGDVYITRYLEFGLLLNCNLSSMLTSLQTLALD